LAMDVPRFVNRGGRGDEPGEISVMIPYWVYRRICDMLVAVGSAAKPEEYITAILEGHVRKLNL
jgi:hypothetical protein